MSAMQTTWSPEKSHELSKRRGVFKYRHVHAYNLAVRLIICSISLLPNAVPILLAILQTDCKTVKCFLRCAVWEAPEAAGWEEEEEKEEVLPLPVSSIPAPLEVRPQANLYTRAARLRYDSCIHNLLLSHVETNFTLANVAACTWLPLVVKWT